MTRTLRTAAAGIAILFASLLGACSDEPDDGVLSELSVTIDKTSIAIGDVAQATANGFDQYNKPITTGDIVWSATGSASVSTTGVVTGVSLGNATIKATVVGRPMSAERVIAVTPKPATRIAVNMDALLVRNGVPFTHGAYLADADGKRVFKSGVVVTLAMTGGGTISGPLTATTDEAGGVAFVNQVVSGVSGKRTLTLTAPTFAAASRPLTLVSGVPSRIEILNGNNQTGEKGLEIAPVLVRVLDADGYPVDGVPVVFTTGLGGGSVRFPNRVSESGGLAGSGEWRLGAVGTNTLIATTPGVPPTTITATATPRLVSLQVSLSAPSVQAGQSIQATVSGRDDTGATYLPPDRVQWFIQGNQTAVITQTGVITGTTAGTATVIVRVAQVFGSTALPVTGAAPYRLVLTTNPTPIQSGTQFANPPVVQLVDQATGLPVAEAGHPVIVSILGPAQSSGILTIGILTGPTTVLTDANGTARFTGLGITSLPGNVELTFRSAGALPIAAPFIGVSPGVPATITIEEGDNQTGVAGEAIPTRPAVAIRDASGSLLIGPFTVTFAVTGGGGTVTNATVTTENGRATVGVWILGAAGTNALRASSPSVPGTVTFTATARPF